jgi:transcriptional regulator with GAF, ATPase, and Fis domain
MRSEVQRASSNIQVLLKEKDTGNNFINKLHLHDLEYLKSVCLLLLHEIESLQRMVPSGVQPDRMSEDFSLSDEIKHIETEFIKHALVRAKGRQNIAAKLLGIKKTTLHEKIRRYGIIPINFEPVVEQLCEPTNVHQTVG